MWNKYAKLLRQYGWKTDGTYLVFYKNIFVPSDFEHYVASMCDLLLDDDAASLLFMSRYIISERKWHILSHGWDSQAGPVFGSDV